MAPRRAQRGAVSGFRKTKIVATIGPASESPEQLGELIEAGVEIARVNFSHGDRAEKQRQIENVRRVAAEAGRPVAVLQDLQGPKVRIGEIRDGAATLVEGETLRIQAEPREGTATALSTSYPRLAAAVSVGDPIFLDDGLIELRVRSIAGGVIEAEIERGGVLTPHKGLNVPGAHIDLPALTPKDEADLRFGLSHGVDMVALSFVGGPEDAEAARAIMRAAGSSPLLIAKIEKRQGFERLDAILRVFDGVLVGRGDLGVDLTPEKVPLAQKRIIARANAHGKPVITATQMLESMTHSRSPTRAEASDVANAVLDGTDAVMLSGETAIGAHPAEAVRAMDRIVREAESAPIAIAPDRVGASSATLAVCAAAVKLASEVGASALAALTRSGRTAQTLSSLRPPMPILALLSRDERLARRLSLWGGLFPIVVEGYPAREDAAQRIGAELTTRGILPRGSLVVIVGAALGGPAGRTNFIRLLRL